MDFIIKKKKKDDDLLEKTMSELFSLQSKQGMQGTSK